MLLIFFACAHLSGQSFYGVVKKADSLSSPIFQAQVEVMELDKPANIYKTYFDGGYKFNVSKNRTYTIKVSYPGYIDTIFTVQTDKAGKPFPPNLIVRLMKDGMRLMGKIRSREEEFPIKEATIILKNVMTKEEFSITTGIDGAYNFKLEYETNYKVSIDKRSTGILNHFKDTSFYVSTIGFNLPLDYKLDIFLDPILNPDPELIDRYNSIKQPFLANTNPTSKEKQERISKAKGSADKMEIKQPFVQEASTKEADNTVSKMQEQLEKTKRELEELKKLNESIKKNSGGISQPTSNRKKKKEDANLEVVIIRDEPVRKGTKETDKIRGVQDSIPR